MMVRFVMRPGFETTITNYISAPTYAQTQVATITHCVCAIVHQYRSGLVDCLVHGEICEFYNFHVTMHDLIWRFYVLELESAMCVMIRYVL